MEAQPDFTKTSRPGLGRALRRRRQLGGALTILGIVGLFAMVAIFVPAPNRAAGPLTAERTLAP